MFQSLFDALAGVSGAPPDYVKLIFLLLIASPLAYPLPRLSPQAKHLTCIAVSAFFLLGILDLRLGFAQLLLTSLLTYGLTAAKVGGKKMPWIVFFIEMAHLTVNHLVRAYGNIPLTTIEITAMQMVLTMNLTTFAWDVYDGQIRTEEECDAQQKTTRIVEMPGLIEFLGYCFYFPGVLIGPSTRFVDYRAWAKGTIYTSAKGKEKDKGQVVTQDLPPPGRVSAALRELAIGLFFLALFTILAPAWDFTALVLPVDQGGLSKKDTTFLYRVWFIVVASFVARTKYYGIWTLTNASCILSGLSYNGLAPISSSAGTEIASRTRWDRCQNVDILGVELAQNWKELLDHWNMNTNVWLRNNLYKRVTRPGKKPGFKSTMTTFLTSAFWHGVSPGYYMAFVYGGFCQSIARSLRKSLRPRFFPPSSSSTGGVPSAHATSTMGLYQWIYVIISIASVHVSLAFAAMAFILLDLKTTWQGWSAVNFFGLYSIAALVIAFRLGLGKHLSGARTMSTSMTHDHSKKKIQYNSDASGGETTETTDKDNGNGNGNGNGKIPSGPVPVTVGEKEQERIGEEILKVETVDRPGVQLLDVDLAERDLKDRLT